MNSKRKVSIVWNFFTAKDDAHTQCNFCGQLLSYKTTRTNLRQHVVKKHPSVRIPNAKEASQRSDRAADDTSDNTIVIQTVGEPTLPTPFSIVEDIGFKEFCQMLNPKYELPSRKTLTKTMLPAKYLETVNMTKKVIELAESITLTTDTWTSRNTDSFMGVTAHFITDFEVKSILLDVFLLKDAHISINLANELRRVVREWEIENKILIAISANAANIKKAIIEDLKWKHFGCLAHTLNLVAQDGLKVVELLIDTVKSIVTFFKRSNLAKEKLDVYQIQHGKHPKKLIQSVPTRWNSVYYMLERVYELQEVRASLAVLGQENILNLNNNDLEEVHQLIKILAPLESATKTMSGEKYVTLSSVILDTFTNIVRKVAENITTSIQSRFKNLTQSMTLTVVFMMNILQREQEIS
nr:unnamed protein product [Callosobruchus analis]